MEKIKIWLKKPFIPFEVISRNQSIMLTAFWLVFIAFFWIRTSCYGDVKFIPSPMEVGVAFQDLFANGLIKEFAKSLGLCLQATLYALLISMVFAYLSPLGWVRPAAQIVSKLRYLPMVGITFYLTQAGLSGRPLQIGILTMFVAVYFITSLMSMIGEIPEEEYNLARTMGCSRWEMLWRVVIKGRLDYLIEILRQNLAITWMMFVTVEVLVVSSGGVGILMKNAEKLGGHDRIFAIQIIILLLGALIDYSLMKLKPAIFPYSKTRKTF